MLNNNLSWINLNVGSGGGGTGGVSDYNDLANRPIKSLQGTSQNPISLWNLSTGLYLLNGYINYDVNNSREGVNLFVSLTAQMQNGQYVMSAFVPSWEAHYEYKKASANTTDYTEHQMLKMLTQDEVLTMTNETPYTPTGDYNPSTKKYVDDSMNAVLEHLSELGVNEQDIQALITENRRRDIAIQALLNETADKNVTIEEETHTISLDYSIEDGMATVNKLEGSTLVNVSKQKEAIDITKSYDVETGNYIHLESEQDGKCKPLFEGNTAVNRAYGERNVVAMPKIESVSNNYHTITNGLDGGKVEVESVKGNTLVNLVELDTTMYNGEGLEWIQGNYIIIDNPPENGAVFFKFKYVKPNTVYTVCFEVLSVFDNGANLALDLFPDEYSELPYQNTTGFKYFTFTTPDDVSTLKYLRYYVSDGRIGICKLTYPMVFEGDLTQTPELIPNEYVEGLESSFEGVSISGNLCNGTGKIPTGVKTDSLGSTIAYADNPTTSSVRIRTDYIDAEPSTTYTVVAYGFDVTIHELDANDIWIVDHKWTFKEVYKFTTNPNCIKVVVYARKHDDSPVINYIDEFEPILLEGDYSTITESEIDSLREYEVDIKVVGKNKLNLPQTFTKSMEWSVINTAYLISLTELKPNTNYYLNLKYDKSNNEIGHGGIAIYMFDEKPLETDRWYLQQTNRYDVWSTTEYSCTINKQFNSANHKYLAIYLGIATNTLHNHIATITDAYLIEGTTATEYEPYKSDSYQLLLNSPLLKDDEIRVQDGWLGHYHKMGKVVLDGSENWKAWTGNFVNVNRYYVVLDKQGKSPVVICDTFPNLTSGDYELIRVGGTYMEELLVHSKYMTLSEFKQWLSENPVTAVYELKEPYFEPLVKLDSLALDIYNTNSTITIDSTVPVQESTVKNLSYKLQGYSSPYVLDYNADGEITHEIVDDRLRVYGNGAIVEDLMMFDGSEVPKSDYFQGLKSVFEEGLITDESDPNYGKYALELKSFTSNHVLGGTKVVYLSSPLLKGDSIEVIDGKLVHVHRYGMVVLDGSEDEIWNNYSGSDEYFNGFVNTTNIKYDSSSNIICDTFMSAPFYGWYDMENVGVGGSPHIQFFISRDRLDTQDISGVRNWLSENPTTVVYELAETWNEVISENIDDITIDTYANGYLGLNTSVYPSNIKFLAFEEELTYLYTSSTYTVQFDSDGEGTIDIILGGASVLNKQVVKGKNNIQVTTPSTLANNKLVMGGYGNYKVSNVVVTNSTKEFDYFEGMKSTFEDTQNEDGTYNVEIVVYNAPVRFGKNNK